MPAHTAQAVLRAGARAVRCGARARLKSPKSERAALRELAARTVGGCIQTWGASGGIKRAAPRSPVQPRGLQRPGNTAVRQRTSAVRDPPPRASEHTLSSWDRAQARATPVEPRPLGLQRTRASLARPVTPRPTPPPACTACPSTAAAAHRALAPACTAGAAPVRPPSNRARPHMRRAPLHAGARARVSRRPPAARC